MVGQSIGHYRILEKIGEGGMGHVFLAEDLTLARKVALKVLAQATPNPDQVTRFEREAKAVAALDHPNILAIHEFGHDGVMPYVVMELLDGRNLRQRLEKGPLPVRTAIEYAIDIVKGLSAAHEKGISHRDLKPENIFITHDGRVKILDFGLASAEGAPVDMLASATQTLTREVLTRPGVVLGTVGYMAPEQVRGERVDSRADIFAFGAVLFEMLTGRRAFYEPTPVETLHAILKGAPSLRLLDQAGAPVTLVQIVARCLDKERDRRFQSTRELGAALQSAQSTGMGSSAVAGAVERLDSWKEIASFLGRGVRTVQRWEREEHLPVHRLEHAKRGSVYADRKELARWWESRERAATETSAAVPQAEAVPLSQPTSLPRVERVTNTSVVTLAPALSSDARMIVYVSSGGQEDAAPQLWLQQVGGAALRLTSEQRECADPVFSADDTQVLFTAKGETNLNVYTVPTLGGQPRLFKRNARSARMSPDGRWLAYVSLESERGLRIERSDGGDNRAVGTDLVDVSCAVWSPDSAHVLVRAHPDPQFEPDFWIVPIGGGPALNTGAVQRFRAQGVALDTPPAWVHDSILFTVAGRQGAILWRQRLTPHTFQTSGDPEPLTHGTYWAGWPTAAAGRLAFVSSHVDMNLWSVAIDPSTGVSQGSPRRLTRGPGICGHLCLAADGKTLTYFSVRTGMPSLFLRDLESGSETGVIADPANVPKAFPTVSPDGRRLAYGTITPGPRAMRPLFILDLPTGVSRQLCEDCGGRPRQWIDDESILVETFGSRLNAFMVVDGATGRQRPLLTSADRSVTNPRLSPDARWIAFDASFPGGTPAVFVAPFGGSASIPEFDWTLVGQGASHPFWSSDGRLLYYLPTTPNRDLRAVVRARRLNTASRQPEGEAFVAASFHEMLVATLIAGNTPVIAGDQMVFVLADVRGDIWMMDV